MWPLDNIQYALIRTVVNTSLYIRRSPWYSPETQPDRIKSYPCRPHLFASRIFTPHAHDGKQLLPLVIRAHGGGFIVNNPSLDDIMARHIADRAKCYVISIDYGKAPQNKFPAAYEDVVALCLAAIEDPELPIDRSRVVLCGSSAGGNLLLSAAQDARLRPRILGVASIYPLVDVVSDGEAKMATRPDPSVPDFIGSRSYEGIKDLYFDAADPPSLTDPRLSPTYFAAREDLPPYVLLVGAEHDMFCHEAEVMAEKLAAAIAGTKVKTAAGWRVPGMQWHEIYGQPHGYDAFPVKDPEKEKARLAAVDELYSVLSDWLADVFSQGGGE